MSGSLAQKGVNVSKIEKVVRLINLLSHRRYTSMEKIKSICGIPERTAYRYLQSISSANIPVTFDREHQGYTLTNKQSWIRSGLSTGEAVIVGVALRLLSRHVNEDYRAEIEELILKVSVQQECAVEDVILAFEGDIQLSGGEKSDMSSLLTSILLHAAIQCDRRVRVTAKDEESGKEPEFDLMRPRLRFERTWQVVDAAEDSDSCRVPLDSVTKVLVR